MAVAHEILHHDLLDLAPGADALRRISLHQLGGSKLGQELGLSTSLGQSLPLFGTGSCTPARSALSVLIKSHALLAQKAANSGDLTTNGNTRCALLSNTYCATLV
jgi:hypothetical protein